MKEISLKHLEVLIALSLPKLSDEKLKERTEWSPERSYGNYDDCFSDGQDNADAYTAIKARELLKEIKDMTPDNKIMDYVVGLEKNLLKVKEENAELKFELNNKMESFGYKKMKDEIEQLKSNLKIAVEALRGLNNEVAAMIATHGDVISQDYGRTNLECLEHRLGIARQALSKIGEL